MISPSSHQTWLFYSPLAQQAALLKDDLLDPVESTLGRSRVSRTRPPHPRLAVASPRWRLIDHILKVINKHREGSDLEPDKKQR